MGNLASLIVFTLQQPVCQPVVNDGNPIPRNYGLTSCVVDSAALGEASRRFLIIGGNFFSR